MQQNYFFLNRVILEANNILQGSVIREIFSQEKGTLVISCENKNKMFFIEFSVIPGSSYFTIKHQYSRAKKNTINFFSDAIHQQIVSFEIANNDRIIRLNLEKSQFYFTIRGKFTNVFHLDSTKRSIPFKSTDEDTVEILRNELLNKKYISVWNDLDSTKINNNNPDEFRKEYPVLGRDIIREVKSLLAKSPDFNGLNNLFEQVLEEVRDSKVCVFIDSESQQVNLGFENFGSIPFTEKKLFESAFEAQNFLLSKGYFLDARKIKLKLIKNHLERELNKVSNKIENLRGVIERGSKEEEYNKIGKLLLANLGAIKVGMSKINLDDIFIDGDKIEIALYVKLSPQKNVEYYFNKSKSERIAFTKSKELFNKAKKDFHSLKNTIESLDEIESIKELDELMKKLKIKSPAEKETKEELSSKFRHYLIDDKYKIFVGKDSKNNDLLTTKFAKPNDYWFHARSVSGSHVVLKVDNTKESVPKNVLKKTAALAAFYSKAKTAGVVPVAYTFKKYVVKKKGDPIGTVHLLREDVLLVKPEIPAGCELILEE